ncbi:MAG: pyridoxamine 5'-phosphate oxidase family protein [Mycobacterium sp.]
MRSLSDQERDRFLQEVRVGVLSVASDPGRPPASMPVWYDYAPAGHVRINTGAASRKARLIRQAGAVTLVVQREAWPYLYVVMEGTVVNTEDPAPRDVREAMAIRYLGEEGGRAFVESMSDVGSVLFTVRPDRWLTSDFS